MSVHFFYGEEDYNIDKEVSKFVSKINPDFLSIGMHNISAPDFETLINALRSPGMMFGNSLYIIDIEKYFFPTKDDPELNKCNYTDSELEEIEDALNNTQDSVDIVFYVKFPRDEGKKIDTRRKLFKILSKFDTKEFQPFKTYNIAEISSWINKTAKSKGITLKSDAVELLIEQFGNNLRQFDSELDKLKLAVHPQTVVTKQTVEDNCISNQDLFKFTDYIMQDKKDCALLEFQKLLDKKHPLEILAAIQTLLRKWIVLKTVSASAGELSKLVGMHEFVVKQTIQKLKNTPVAELVKLKQNLFDIEYKIKTGEVLDINSEVECAIIK